MKKMLAVLMVLLIIIAVGPWVAGGRAKTELDNLAAVISAQSDFTAVWGTYRQGWLSSRGELYISWSRLGGLAQGVDNNAVPVRVHLNHGPILFGDGFRPGWFSGVATITPIPDSAFSEHVKFEGDGPLWQTSFFMGLAGRTLITDRAKAMEVVLGDESMILAGFKGEGEVVPFGDFKYSGQLPSLILKSDSAEVTFNNVGISANLGLDARALAHNFAPGSIGISVSHGVGAGESLTEFQLNNLSATLDNVLHQKADLADTKIHFAFDQLQLADNTIDNFNFDFSFENLSLGFLKKYSDSMNDLAKAESQASAMGFDVLGIIASDLVPHGPQAKVSDLSFKSDKGGLKLWGEAKVPAPASGQQVNLFTLVQTLLVSAQIEADKPLVLAMLEQSAMESMTKSPDAAVLVMTPAQIEAAVKQQAAAQLDLLQLQGLLIVTGSAVTAELTFKDGVALVNGKPMPLSF